MPACGNAYALFAARTGSADSYSLWFRSSSDEITVCLYSTPVLNQATPQEDDSIIAYDSRRQLQFWIWLYRFTLPITLFYIGPRAFQITPSQALFSLPLVSSRDLLNASMRTHVVALIFSLIIKSKAELNTVFKIWARKPLKKPRKPSLFHMANRTPRIVLRGFFWAFSATFSLESAAWIMTLHLHATKC